GDARRSGVDPRPSGDRRSREEHEGGGLDERGAVRRRGRAPGGARTALSATGRLPGLNTRARRVGGPADVQRGCCNERSVAACARGEARRGEATEEALLPRSAILTMIRSPSHVVVASLL